MEPDFGSLLDKLRAALESIKSSIEEIGGKIDTAAAKYNPEKDNRKSLPPLTATLSRSESEVNDEQAREARKERREARNERRDRRRITIETVALWMSGILVLANLVVLVVYWLQLGMTAEAIRAQYIQMQQSRLDGARTLSQSRDTLNAQISQFRLDQRAWVAVKDVHSVTSPSEPIVTFLNTGHTPAIDVTAYTNRILVDKGNRPKFTDVGEKKRLGILSPVTERTLGYIPLPVPSDKKLYVWGTFTYRDIFKTCHWVTFCSRLSDDRKWFEFCEEHNDTDKNEETPSSYKTCPTP